MHRLRPLHSLYMAFAVIESVRVAETRTVPHLTGAANVLWDRKPATS